MGMGIVALRQWMVFTGESFIRLWSGVMPIDERPV